MGWLLTVIVLILGAFFWIFGLIFGGIWVGDLVLQVVQYLAPHDWKLIISFEGWPKALSGLGTLVIFWALQDKIKFKKTVKSSKKKKTKKKQHNTADDEYL